MLQAANADVTHEAATPIRPACRAATGCGDAQPPSPNHSRTVAERLGYGPHAGARDLSLSRALVPRGKAARQLLNNDNR